MKPDSIEQYLSAIRDRYRTIHALTANLTETGGFEEFEAAVVQRRTLLTEIHQVQKSLVERFPDWRGQRDRTCIALTGEIHALIQEILNLDSASQAQLRTDMTQCRKELTGLGKSVRAAGAYTRHSVLTAAR